MLSPTRSLTNRFLKYAAELRFPRLLALTLVLFAVDFIVPDVIPFADEILLGLFAALLATLKKSRRDRGKTVETNVGTDSSHGRSAL